MEEVTLEEDWDARYRKFGSDSGTTPRMFPGLRLHLLFLLLTTFAPDSIERQSRCFLRVSGSRSDAISRWKVLLCSGRSHAREGQRRGRRRGCSGVGRRHSRAGAASTLFLPAHITAARMSRAPTLSLRAHKSSSLLSPMMSRLQTSASKRQRTGELVDRARAGGRILGRC